MTNGFLISLLPYWQTMLAGLLHILLRPPLVNSKNNLPIVFSTMKTNVPRPWGSIAHANTLTVLRRLFWIPLSLLDLLSPRMIPFRLQCGIYKISLQRPILGHWVEGLVSPLDTFYQKARNIMGQAGPSLDFSKHHSNRCSPPWQSSCFSWFHEHAQTTSQKVTFTNYFTFFGTTPLLWERRTYDSSTKIFLASLLALTLTDFFKVGTCYYGSWKPTMSVQAHEFFSVSPVKQNNPGDIVKGRLFRTLNVNRHIKIGDVPELIIAALGMQNFQLGSKVYTQVQGSPMGSPLSPALCLMVVSVYEQIWYHTHRESISNLHLHALFLRYVDNRLVILPTLTKDLPAFQILVDPDFYKAPIFLETEPDQEFLGFQVELDPFELCYQPPQDLSQVLSPMSASPPAVLLSGFASRCSIVHRGSFPKLQVDKGILSLKKLYLKAGFNEADLDKIVKRVLKQRK